MHTRRREVRPYLFGLRIPVMTLFYCKLQGAPQLCLLTRPFGGVCKVWGVRWGGMFVCLRWVGGGRADVRRQR